MPAPTSTVPSPEEAENDEQLQQSTASPSEVPGHHDQQPTLISNDAASNTDDPEMLPNYSQHPDGDTPRLPSYARVTRTDQRRRESLQAFLETKKYAQDTFGGHKGITDGPPNDPLKPFRWIRRKARGEKDVWRKLSIEERRKWEEDGGPVNYDGGEVARRDMDTSRIL